MLQTKLILSNALAIWICRLLLILPQLILTPLLLDVIGEEGYGIFVLMWALFLAIDQLEVALQSGMIKYAAALLAEGQQAAVCRLLRTSFAFSLFIGVLAVAAVIFISRNWTVQGHDLTMAWVGLGMITFSIILVTPYAGIVKACQRQYIEVIAETSFRLLGIVLIFCWMTWLSASPSAAILISATMLLFSRLVQIPFAKRLVPGLRFSPSLSDLPALKKLLVFGMATVLVALSSIANDAGLRWLMEFFQGPSFVAHLAIMLIPGAILIQFARALTVTVMPASSALAAGGNHARLQDLLFRGIRYTTAVAGLGFLAASLLLENAFRIWLGVEYLFLVPHTLGVIAAVCIRMSAMIARPILQGVGRLRPTVVIALLADAVVPLGLVSFVFLWTSNPYLAVTSGLIVGNLLWALLHCACAANATQFRLRDIAVRIYVPCLVSGLVAWGFGTAILSMTSLDSLLLRLICFGLVASIFVVQVFWLFVTSQERQMLRDWASSVFWGWLQRMFKSR